jgi:4-amino-4-deoxy-L-arabinose transferase-like glycosyltransferase
LTGRTHGAPPPVIGAFVGLAVASMALAMLPFRLQLVEHNHDVGHADAAAYAEMADSLIHGRWFHVDYISWYFIKYAPDIVRPEDHWPPLYSLTIAPFFLLLGKTAFAAKLPSLIISCFLLPLVIYSLTRELSNSKLTGLAAGVGVLFSPVIFRDSLYCLSDIIYTFVVCAGVLFAAKSLDDERYFYPLGIFIGLAYYAKGSGLIPIPFYALFYVISYRSIKKVITDKRIWISFLIAFLALLPWLIRNYVHFRDPLFSTQRFSAGYVGYENWEAGTYDLYWGEKPPPGYFDKYKEELISSIGLKFMSDLDNGNVSEELKKAFKTKKISLPDDTKISVKIEGDKWLIKDKNIYTVRKKDDKLNIYIGGIPHVIKMTKDYLKQYFWWIFMDIRSGWGKFGSEAFLTYFTNLPALLGLFLLWGNRKRHAVWLISLSLILFLSIGWSPIYRLALPMIPLMMAMGWATYFVILRAILRLLSKIPLGRLRVKSLEQKIINSRPGGFVSGKWNAEIQSLISLKDKLELNAIAGFIICFMAMSVIIPSAESVRNSIKKSGYPYREGAQEWMDMGNWLRENALSDSITMTRNPWELHFYSEQPAIQIPRTTLNKTIEVMLYYKPDYIIPQLDIRPSLKPLVEGKLPGLELIYDNKKIQLYKINYDILPKPDDLKG